MANCPKCGSHVGCSCQLMTLPDGTTGCSSCYNQYVQNTAAQTVSGQEYTPEQLARLKMTNNGSS